MPCSLDFEVPDIGPFISRITPSPETTDRDLEILKQELELYLADLKRRLEADLLLICNTCCPSGSSP